MSVSYWDKITSNYNGLIMFLELSANNPEPIFLRWNVGYSLKSILTWSVHFYTRFIRSSILTCGSSSCASTFFTVEDIPAIFSPYKWSTWSGDLDNGVLVSFLTVVDLQELLRDRDCLYFLIAGVVTSEDLKGTCAVFKLKFCFFIYVEIVSRMNDCFLITGFGLWIIVTLTAYFLCFLTMNGFSGF